MFKSKVFPVIKYFSGVTHEQNNRIVCALKAVIKEGDMSQMGIIVGLCNILSLCLEAAILKIKTAEHREAILQIEEHLSHTANILSHLRRHPEDIPQNT